jgi:LacI family transcriptional regulator
MAELGSIRMRDIARLANVSAGTVSRVLNGRPGVGPETRLRVEALITEHGFRANASAQQLSTGRSRTVGVVFPVHASEVVMHPIYPALLAGLGDAAEERAYDLMLLSASSLESVEHLRDTIRRRRVDGVVLPAAGPRDRLLHDVLTSGVPTVLIGHRARHPRVGWVDSTHDAAARDLTDLMIEGGRRELVMLNGPDTVSATRLRSNGFWQSIQEHPDGVDWASEYRIAFDTVEARAIARSILDDSSRPTAIVGGNDLIAIGVMQAARELGLAIPADLAVSGFDDRSFAATTTPPLSTARMPLQDIGAAAAHLLFALIEAEPVARRHVILPTQVVIRGTTPPMNANGAVAHAGDDVARNGSGAHHVRSVGPAPTFHIEPTQGGSEHHTR